MGPLGAVRIACASLLFLQEILSSMKAGLFRTPTGNGDQMFFVRSCLRQDKLELVCTLVSIWPLCTQHALGCRSMLGGWICSAAHDRGLTGDGSTQNSFYELPNEHRFVTKYIIKVHLRHFSGCVSIHLLMLNIQINQLYLKTLSDMCSPLMGADGGMHRDPRDRLPCTSVRLAPPPLLSISGNRAGSFGAAVAIWVIFAPTSPDPALWLADALAAAEPVDHVLGYRLIEALPVLLRDEYSGKHGGMWGKEKEQYWFRSTTKEDGGKASQRNLQSARKNPGTPV